MSRASTPVQCGWAEIFVRMGCVEEPERAEFYSGMSPARVVCAEDVSDGSDREEQSDEEAGGDLSSDVPSEWWSSEDDVELQQGLLYHGADEVCTCTSWGRACS